MRPTQWRLRSGSAAQGLSRGRCLDDAERARILQPLQNAFVQLRRGVGTAGDWREISGMLAVAQAIELQRPPRGLHGHLYDAELALQTIHRRAEEDSSRYPYALYLVEIEAIQTAIDLHAFQIARLSRNEYDDAVKRAKRSAPPAAATLPGIPAQPAQQQALPL